MRVMPLHACLLCLVPAVAAAQWTPLAADASRSQGVGPLKGWAGYRDVLTDTPCSLEFEYVPLAALMNGPSSFTFETGLDPLLDDVASRGRQAVVRVYLDYPDNPPTGVPAFLSGVSFTTYTDHGGGRSPDYTNASLRAALLSFIAAYGDRYDGDPRLAYVQVGLLGFWGEWHTYPRDALMAPDAVRREVLTAFDDAFDVTPVLVSADVLQYAEASGWGTRNIGLHDDDFGNSTPNPDYGMVARLAELGLSTRWRDVPIGGEVQPDIQDAVLSSDSSVADLLSNVDAAHATWLLNYTAVNEPLTAARRTRADSVVTRMGYRFTATEVRLPALSTGQPLDVALRIRNDGVAPFPARWPLELQMLNASQVVGAFLVDTPSITSVPPGAAPVEFTWTGPHALAAGTYTVRARVKNPLPNGFPVPMGNAAYQDGWLVLGDLVVTSAQVEDAGTLDASVVHADAAVTAEDAAVTTPDAAVMAPDAARVDASTPDAARGDDASTDDGCACDAAGGPVPVGALAFVLAAAWHRRRRATRVG